jgi:hypothetical protein
MSLKIRRPGEPIMSPSAKRLPDKSPDKSLRAVAAGDVALMRKPHPCGSAEWAVTRVGADIGLRCRGCGRKVMLTREAFERGARRLIEPKAASAKELEGENGE